MRSIRELPGPAGHRLVGNTYDYEQDRIGFLIRCQHKYGDVFRFSKTTTVLQDPDLIHELFVRTNTDFLTDAPLFSGGDVAQQLTEAIPSTMAGRRKSWRGMNRSVAAAHGARFLTHLDAALATVSGRALDPLPVMRTFSGFAISDYCLGGRDGSGIADVAKAVDDAASTTLAVMTSSLTFPRWLPIPRVRRTLAAEARLNAILARRVRHRRELGPAEQPADLLDVLLLPSGPQLDDDIIVRILSVLMRASHGVPGATLTWALREFAADPEVQERVRLEAGAVDAARRGDAIEPSDLPYTEAMVKELLRLYPPTWLMGRTALRPTQLGEWELPPGHEVMFSPYLSHRDPRWWTEPETFRPERWLSSDLPYKGRAYYPFGAGPRICVGNQVGMLQVTLAVAHLAGRYDIAATSLDDATPDPGALLVPKALRIGLTSRAGGRP